MKNNKTLFVTVLALAVFTIIASNAYAGKTVFEFKHGPFAYLQQQINDLDSRITVNETSITDLKGQMAGSFQEILGLQAQMQQVQQEIASLQEDVSANGERIDNLQMQYDELQVRFDAKVATLYQKIDEVKNGLQEQIDMLLQQNAAYGEMIAQNQARLAELRNDLVAYVAELNEVSGNVANNQVMLNELQTACLNIQNDIIAVQSDISQLQRQITANQTAIEQLSQNRDLIARKLNIGHQDPCYVPNELFIGTTGVCSCDPSTGRAICADTDISDVVKVRFTGIPNGGYCHHRDEILISSTSNGTKICFCNRYSNRVECSW